MKQMTLAAVKGFEKHRRATRKAEFLARMESLMPWSAFCALIEPHYPKAGNGRPPVGVERMLRMYCIANWFNLSDEACEDALYDVPVFREFCRIDLGRERVPSVPLYVAMGWLGVIAAVPLVQELPAAGLAWLVAGGLLYTAGIVFYANDERWRHAHGVWHLFVLAGTFCHFTAVRYYAA